MKNIAKFLLPFTIILLNVAILLNGLVFNASSDLRTSFLEKVTVHVVNAKNEKITGVNIYAITYTNKTLDSSLWADILPSIKKICIKIPNDKLSSIDKIIVTIGKKSLTFDDIDKLYNSNVPPPMLSDNRKQIETTIELPIIPEHSLIAGILGRLAPIINLNTNLFEILFQVSIILLPVISFILILITLVYYFVIKCDATNSIAFFTLQKNISVQGKNNNIVYNVSIFVITLLITAFYATRGFDVLHNGLMFYIALKISEGHMLFKEIYSHYGPLTSLLQAASLLIVAKKMIVIQYLTAITYAIIYCLCFNIWKRFLPISWALFSVVISILLAPYIDEEMLPWSSVTALLFQAIAFFYMIKYNDNNKQYNLYVTGIAIALCFWSRQPVGLLLLITVLLYMIVILKNRKELLLKAGAILLGFSIVSLLFIIWLSANGAIYDWWQQNFIGIFNWAFSVSNETPINAKINKFISHLICFLPLSIWIFFPLMMLFLFFSGSSGNVKKRELTNASRMSLLIAFFYLGSWAQFFPTADHRHYYWAALPFIGIFISIIVGCFEECMLTRRKVVVVILLLTVLVTIKEVVPFITSGIDRLCTPYYEIKTPYVLQGMKIPHKEIVLAYQKLDSALIAYQKQFKHFDMISLSKYNVLVLTLVNNNKPLTPFPTPVFAIEPSKTAGDYDQRIDNAIKNKSVLVYTENDILINGYRKYFYIKNKEKIGYSDYTWFIYSPETNGH